MIILGWIVNRGQASQRGTGSALYKLLTYISANPSIHTRVQWEKDLGISLNHTHENQS